MEIIKRNGDDIIKGKIRFKTIRDEWEPVEVHSVKKVLFDKANNSIEVEFGDEGFMYIPLDEISYISIIGVKPKHIGRNF